MPRLCPPAKLHAAMTLVEDDLDAGLERLEALARKYAKDPAVRFGYGTALMDAGAPADALDHLEFVEHRDPGDDARETLLDAYFALGMVVHAARLLERTGRSLDDEIDEEVGAEVEIVRNHGPDWRDLPRKDLLALERARVAIVRGERGAVDQLALLTKSHPTWTAACNALAGARLVAGDLDGFYAAATDALETDPEDAQALLYATRAALMREGTEAARAFRGRLPSVRAHRGVGAALAFRAETAALMDDAEALQAALDALDAAEPRPDADVFEDVGHLRDAVALREDDPSAPLISLDELYFGLFASWARRNAAEVEARAGRELARAPGLLRELPRRLGYEREGTVRILASVLLSAGAPPAPEASWGELLTRIATEGPGTRSGRAALLTFLHEVGELDASEGAPFAGTDEGVTVHDFEVTGEPLPSPLTDREQERVQEVMSGLFQGRLAPALAVLPELIERHPDEPSLAFNLAVAEKLAGRVAQARARVERLLETHPDYLFARAQLAVEAVDAGDLDRAEELLAVPVERTRLHVHEWATYAAALGRVALARGDVPGAERYLDGIERTAGQENGPYRMLQDAIDTNVLTEGADRSPLGGGTAGGSDDDVLPGPAEAFHDRFGPALDVPLAELGGTLDRGDAHDSGAAPGFGDVLDAAPLDDAPEPAELASLPRRDEAWHLKTAPVAFAIGQDGTMRRTGLLAIAQEDGFVRTITLFDEPLDARTAYAHLAHACTGGMSDGDPGRPDCVVSDDPALATELREALRGSGIDARQGEVEAASAAIEGVTEELGSGVPAWLAHASTIEARSFLHACDAFFGAESWDAFPPDRPLAFRVGADAWRYATLMGQAGEEFGVAIFASWSAYLAFADPDVEDHERLGAAGSFESVSLSPLGAVPPLDAPFYLEAIDARRADDAVPLLARFEPDGLTAPEYRPSVYAALLELLARRAGRVTTRVRRIDATVQASDAPVRVRYPATGGEGAEEPGTETGLA